jgi:hypothetical protein
MNNTIVLSAFTFGSIYLFSVSLNGLNKKWLKNEEKSSLYEFVNGTILSVSGIAIVATFYNSFKN